MSELRIVLLGASWSERNSVGNFILASDAFKHEVQSCLRISTTLNKKQIAVINTPDLEFETAENQTQFIKDCMKASAPGPHVFLLLLHPEDFTQKHKDRFNNVLETFSEQSFGHALILSLTPREPSSGGLEKYLQNHWLNEMIKKCRQGYLMQENLKLPELLRRFDQIAKENREEYVTYEVFHETTGSLQAGDDQISIQEKKLGFIMTAVAEAGIQGFRESPHHFPASGEYPTFITILHEYSHKSFRLISKFNST